MKAGSMIHRCSYAVVLVTLACGLTGCSTTGNLTNIDIEKVSRQIVPGKTTKQQVLNLLGQPMSRGAASDGREMWMYFCSNENSIKRTQMGSTYLATQTAMFIPGASGLLAMGGAATVPHGQSKSVIVHFNGNIVGSCSIGDNSSTMNTSAEPFGANQNQSPRKENPDSSIGTSGHDESKAIEGQLTKLKELKESGIVTEEEYETRRTALIDKLLTASEPAQTETTQNAAAESVANMKAEDTENYSSSSNNENLYKFSVMGLVNIPGTYSTSEQINLNAAIEMAGGISKLAAPKRIFIIRDKVKQKTNGEMLVKDGDVIFVPEKIW